jgi:hypothetical protein
MKKLEEIPKKEVFSVPDDYFDKLPGIIQARVAKPVEAPRVVFSYALRYALPAIVLFALGIFWFTRQQETVTAESIIASIQTEDLVAYLNHADLTTDELLDQVMLDNYDAYQIEQEVFGLDLDVPEGMEDLEDILDEMDLNTL